jgi:hypothetical protein
MKPHDDPTPAPPALAEMLALAARSLQQAEPPAALREQVLARAKARLAPPPARPPRQRRAWSGALAVAAMLLVASPLLLMLSGQPAPADAPPARTGEFVPLVPREQWPSDTTPAWLVQSELSEQRVAALGLPYDPGRAAAPVRAELLVHPSGLVLALRLID